MTTNTRVAKSAFVARDLLNPNHPLHNFFKNWVTKRGQEPTLRQARKCVKQTKWLKAIHDQS